MDRIWKNKHDLQMQEIWIRDKEVLSKGLSFELIFQVSEYLSPEIDILDYD